MKEQLQRFRYETAESLKLAIFQIGANRIRSFLTALGVIIGIVSITMMGTAINGIDLGFEKSLSMLGYDVIYVQKTSWSTMGEWWRYRNRPDLKTEYAQQINRIIADDPRSELEIAVPQMSTYQAMASYRDRSIEQVFSLGTNENYLKTASGDLAAGRFFTPGEAAGSEMVCVVGDDIATGLFPLEDPIGKKISIKNRKFRIVGVFRKQGKFLGLFSFDNQIIMPLEAFEKVYGRKMFVTLRVKIRNEERVAQAREELLGLMRRIRKIPPGKEDNFSINEQRAFKSQLDPIKNGIAAAGIFITGMSLFVGAIGIMNITFVSVRERTREIGLRKALGARRRTILMQFLIESVMICLLGGLVGLLTSLGITFAIEKILPDFPIQFSFGLVLASLAVSVLTGIISGLAPAVNASKLDPADSLRYE
ncbi:MAG: ABC transporter permease [Chlorobium sp.]|uniref:ABC transporter permease n=1 Tax=Chlorobium sp. TaxID=1095 RepID=UPI0025BDB580|nr:ABC transporter permease [Chlorobium sp.]MCF8215702.1 ABC transporter permease [Chlorobium sp.]MCF8270564.1 ABC transporter permease [Chlorobium sp.]MCF8286911.1 ABC transporter permease [Chlorobium sp.]MCF8290507.1 ABC transporter permease [Chlorobium sp.]MCF8384593.1 ABC transporter permease [Chlorobium sp.]